MDIAGVSLLRDQGKILVADVLRSTASALMPFLQIFLGEGMPVSRTEIKPKNIAGDRHAKQAGAIRPVPAFIAPALNLLHYFSIIPRITHSLAKIVQDVIQDLRPRLVLPQCPSCSLTQMFIAFRESMPKRNTPRLPAQELII